MKIGPIDFNRIKHPIIVAELGTLHHHQGKNGVLKAIDQAFSAGADMVKIQYINPLYSSLWATEAQQRRYEQLDAGFSLLEAAETLLEANRRHKNRVFASVFDLDSVYALEEIVPCVKIAQRSSAWLGLKDAIESLNKPYIVSLSNEYPETWRTKPNNCLYLACKAFTYPIQYVAPIPENFDGYSLHTNDRKLLKTALAQYPKLIEVHVKGSNPSGFDTKIAITMSTLEWLKNQAMSVRLYRGTPIAQYKFKAIVRWEP